MSKSNVIYGIIIQACFHRTDFLPTFGGCHYNTNPYSTLLELKEEDAFRSPSYFVFRKNLHISSSVILSETQVSLNLFAIENCVLNTVYEDKFICNVQ